MKKLPPIQTLSPPRTPKELARAAEYLGRELTPDQKSTIAAGVNAEGKKWLGDRYHSLGRFIRNTLRKGNFAWGVETLEGYWDEAVLLMLKNDSTPTTTRP